jgi:hypothetical protein
MNQRNPTMKTDLYTKCVLTVIAIALTLLALQNTSLVNEAKADPVNFNKLPAPGYATIPVNADGSLNVKVINDMDVNIQAVFMELCR